CLFFFSSRRRHTRSDRDWSSDVCSSDLLHVVPDVQIEALQRVLAARAPVLPYPFLQEGQRVRIARGPLADVEGILVQSKLNKGRSEERRVGKEGRARWRTSD